MREKKIINIGQPGDKATVPRIARRLNQPVMAAMHSEMHKRGHRPATLPILQSNNGRQTQTIGD